MRLRRSEVARLSEARFLPYVYIKCMYVPAANYRADVQLVIRWPGARAFVCSLSSFPAGTVLRVH